MRIMLNSRTKNQFMVDLHKYFQQQGVATS
jgi:hypothetical protein